MNNGLYSFNISTLVGFKNSIIKIEEDFNDRLKRQEENNTYIYNTYNKKHKQQMVELLTFEVNDSLNEMGNILNDLIVIIIRLFDILLKFAFEYDLSDYNRPLKHIFKALRNIKYKYFNNIELSGKNKDNPKMFLMNMKLFMLNLFEYNSTSEKSRLENFYVFMIKTMSNIGHNIINICELLNNDIINNYQFNLKIEKGEVIV